MARPLLKIGVLAAAALSLHFTAVAATNEPASAASAASSATRPPYRLQWTLVENAVQADGRLHSRAAFLLINDSGKALPAKGWSIYFNCMDGIQLLGGDLKMERVNGSLFRLSPTAAFGGLAPGQTLRVEYLHSYLVKSSLVPAGPYIVFDTQPDKGYAFSDYRVTPPNRAEKAGSIAPHESLSPQAIYEKNAQIDALAAEAIPPVMPTPLELSRSAGTLRLASMPAIDADPSLKREAEQAAALLKPYLPQAKSPAHAAARVILRVAKVPGQDSPEAYKLDVDPARGISITGNSSAGVFYGLQSLRQLLPIKPAASLRLDALRIVDAPRFPYRGFHLDVSRNFHSKQEVMKLLDLMSRYKMNAFHFHLTDDEGWRLEMPGIPELTSIGARRGHSITGDALLPAHGSGADVNDPHGSGYYSRAEYIDILKYATVRHIEVIPEIEMPGHARAAVKSMESRFRRLTRMGDPAARKYLLSDPDDRSTYLSPQGYNDHVMNPGLPSTYAFIGRVLDDVIDVYKAAGAPLKTIHVGGDELPAGAWEKSPASQALMKSMGFGSTAELWNYFYGQVDGMLRERGLTASGWEELGLRRAGVLGGMRQEPNPVFLKHGFRLYIWNNVGGGSEDLAYRLANAGYDSVLAPATHLYFDMAYAPDADEPGVDWAGYIDLDTVYGFVPVDYFRNSSLPAARLARMQKLTEDGRRHILGLQACLWSETVRDDDRVDYMTMPRLLAVAERAWAADPDWAREADPAKAKALYRRAWSGFVHAAGKRELPRLDADGLKLGYRIPPPGLKLEDGMVMVNHQLPGFALRYASGRDPDADSPIVSGPIAAKGEIHVAAFGADGRRGRVSVMENP